MKNNIISWAMWDFSLDRTALIGIFLGLGLWVLYEVVWHREFDTAGP